MHISRLPPSAGHRPVQRPSQRGVIIMVILCLALALAGSLWLSQHGMAFACGGDDAAACAGP